MNVPAYRIDGRPATREAFYAVACDARRSVVVEACAGAGKTWMLVSRILRALLDGAQPQEILAITFTRKAAGEMRERLAEWLREFSDASEEDRVAALRQRGLGDADARDFAPRLGVLHEQLLRGGRSVEVRTFHAWFSQLMRAAPFDLLDELGLQPRMELIEDIEDLKPDLFRRFHARVLADEALHADYLAIVRERGRSQCTKWLLAALAKRVEIELADADGSLQASVEPVAMEPGLSHPAEELQGERWRRVLHELAAGLGRGGARAQKAAAGLVAALSLTDGHLAFEEVWCALFTENDTPRKHLGKVEGLIDAQSALERLAERVHAHGAFIEHGRMVSLARALLGEYAALKRERALVDMADLERVALALLRDATLAGWVQERLDARIRHVLIDEFQDTSPLQWHALHGWLSSYAGAGGGASGQRPPSVFIVGDPKQSIYRFRGADPRVFQAAREFVAEGLDGALLECDHTRRNAPGVISLLNDVFNAARLHDGFDGFRAHTTEVAASQHGAAAGRALPMVQRPPRESAPADDGAPLLWRPSLTQPRREPERVLREQEARHVADAVSELVAQGVAPGDIFVLSRKRAPLRLCAAALQTLHLPFTAPEEFALIDAPEVRDLLALLDVLASPGHDLSLAQALKSPLFGVSDDDLLALARDARSAGSWWQALMCSELHTLERARRLLGDWATAAQRLPPHDLLDRIVAQSELMARLAVAVPAARRRAALQAVEALLAQALELDGGRYATPYGFVRALRQRALSAIPPAQPDAVQLLTVHGAKGLEARFVFVMDTDPEAQNPDTASVLVDWPVQSLAPRRCAFLYNEARCPSSLMAALGQERAARQREELNGLYVAMTRARDGLVFSGVQPHRATPQASWWGRAVQRLQPWVPQPARALMPADVALIHELPALPRSGRAPLASESGDDLAARLGQAVHRVLEWRLGSPAETSIDELSAAAADEFGLAPGLAGEVGRLVQAMLGSPSASRFFGDAAIEWAGNEVPLSLGGEALRVDRLVARRERDGRRVWWILDYKLRHQPQQLAAYTEQMHRYRKALRLAQPHDDVRCAFVTGAGEVVEV